MKKIMSLAVVGGLCISGTCFGMDSMRDPMQNDAHFVSQTVKSKEQVKYAKRNPIVKNVKTFAVLGASALLIGGGILAYRQTPLIKSFTKSSDRSPKISARGSEMKKKSTITCITYRWLLWGKPIVKCFREPNTWEETWTDAKMSLSVLTATCPFVLGYFGVMGALLYGASYLNLLP